MRDVALTPPAREALKAILRHSRQRFGPEARRRYRLLFEQAFQDLADDPERAGVRAAGARDASIRLYAVRHAQARVAAPDRVANPSHVIAFRFDDERVEIVRLLHERMDLPTRLR